MKKSLLVAVLIALILSVVLFFVFQKNKIGKNPKTQPTEQSQNNQTDQKTEEVSDKPVEIVSVQGKLLRIKETSIEVLPREKIKEESSKKIEERMEIYNINAKTPVFRGAGGKTKSGLYELELGQPITVEYNKETNDAIRIIIIDSK